MRIAALALTVLLAGCSAPPMASSAAGCWGTGAVASGAACQDAIRAPLGALGHTALAGLDSARAGGTCGGFVDCAEAIRTTPAPTPRPTPRPVVRKTPTPDRATNTPAPTNTPTAVATNATPTPAAATPTPEPATPTDTGPTPTPTQVQEEQVASASSNSCAGVTLAGIESKSSLTAAEQACAMDAATGKAGVPSSDVQSAAIALRNTRAKGWPNAVESALKQGSLANAPLLNFAGIEPAYNGKRYKTVLKRARIVWNNRGKGYQFSGKDLDFIVEFSCRSAGQLALSGKPANDGVDWCERWLDRAESAGKATQEIEDLIRQVE